MLDLNVSGFSLHQVELGYWAGYCLAAMFGNMRPHGIIGQAEEKSKQKIIYLYFFHLIIKLRYL